MTQVKYANKISKLFRDDGTSIYYHKIGGFITLTIPVLHAEQTVSLTIDTKLKKVLSVELNGKQLDSSDRKGNV